jgi:hypothetical protein
VYIYLGVVQNSIPPPSNLTPFHIEVPNTHGQFRPSFPPVLLGKLYL